MPAHTPILDREDLLQAPAHIIIDKTGATYDLWKYVWCDGNVTVQLAQDKRVIKAAGFGEINQTLADERVEVDFTPAGNMDSAVLAWLYQGVLSKRIGALLFGSAADAPAYVHTLDGKILGVTCAAPIQFPTLVMGVANQRNEGSSKMVGVIGKGLARTAANALFTPWASLAFLRQPVPSEWSGLPVRATWTGLVDGETTIEIEPDENGWKVDLGVSLVPAKGANVGTIDYKITAIAMTARCTPLNLSEVHLWSSKVIGSSRALGTSVAGTDLTLAEDYGGITAVLKGAKMTANPLRYSESDPRAGECVWTSYRDFSTGALGVPGSVSMTPDPEA